MNLNGLIYISGLPGGFRFLGGIGYIGGGGGAGQGHSVEDHYPYKKWNFTG